MNCRRNGLMSFVPTMAFVICVADSENGFSANFNIYPDKDAVVILLTNCIPHGDFMFQRRVVNRITPALFGAALQTEPPVRPGP